MLGDIIARGSLKIAPSKISNKMIHEFTKPLLNAAWLSMLDEVDYAAKAINTIERKPIYDGSGLLVDKDDPILKPDHTAARGFVDSRLENNLGQFDVEGASYDQLQEIFVPLTGTAISTVILQMLGGELFTGKPYNFPVMHAEGTNIFFKNSGDVVVDRTKHFVSNQDIAKLDEEYQQAIISSIKDGRVTITEDDWQALKTVYKGGELSADDLAKILPDFEKRVFSCMWGLDYDSAIKLQKAADSGEKPYEYAYSTLIRGNRLNHGTWRVADINRGMGVLCNLNTNPVPIRGEGTFLEQTAGMATVVKYKTKQGKEFEGPGAFLEIASRPYMLINKDFTPVDLEGEIVDLDKDEMPYLFHEVVIELDTGKWQGGKVLITNDGDLVSLAEVNAGKYGDGRFLTISGKALCYEGFKEANAKGIFFAAGGNVKNK